MNSLSVRSWVAHREEISSDGGPAVDEPQHIQRSGDKLMLDGCRFVQAGSWSGVLRVEGRVTGGTDGGAVRLA